jgi:hypothetical protein
VGRIEEMTFNVQTSSVRTIRKGEKGFMLIDGMFTIPRAGFEINKSCPSEFKMIIADCINNGWLKPVAHVKDNELFWESFKE